MTQTDAALARKIAQFDALFDEDTTIEDAYEKSTGRVSPSPVDDGTYHHTTPAPFLHSDDQQDSEEDEDVVHAMQELLLKHENTQINRIEDPDLVRVLKELRTLAHSNIADVFKCEEVLEYVGADDNDKDVYKTVSRLKVHDITKLPREVSGCIQSIKITSKVDGDIVEVKMYDKQVSLDKLMRFHGAYMRDNEQNQNNSAGVMDLLLSSIGSQGMPTCANNDA